METQNSVIANNTLRLVEVFSDWSKVSSSKASGDYELSFGLLEITPQAADKLLLTQVVNRKPSSTRILEYSRRLESGEWTISDALKFDIDGHLIDGQHRLCAVRKSGISAVFPVLSGYPPDSQSVIDIGLNRTVAQIAQVQGIIATNAHISMVRALHLVQPNGGKIPSMSSPQKVLSILATHRDAIEFALKKNGSGIMFAPVRAVVARAWYHENRPRLEQFLYVFDTGFSNGPEDSAAVCLRNSYNSITKGIRNSGGSSFRVDFAKKAVSALEAFLAGEKRTAIKAKSTCKWKIEGVD
jgi:hypothetical protein